MSIYIVDVEADGPIPGPYSMVSFGAVRVGPGTMPNFYGTTKPISDKYVPEALSISGMSREQHLQCQDPAITMKLFDEWIAQTNTGGRPTFMSDNLAFDWQWINWYFHNFLNKNPFGFSGRRIGDLYAGATLEFRNTNDWKKYRRAKHDHNPVNDALGNAQALLTIIEEFDIR